MAVVVVVAGVSCEKPFYNNKSRAMNIKNTLIHTYLLPIHTTPLSPARVFFFFVLAIEQLLKQYM